jgi:tetratricopeptide (TPR) repeat protein
MKRAVADPGLMAAGEALAGNDIPRAEALLRAHLRRAPADVAAIRMLAEVAARIGRYEDAAALLERCLELEPGFDAARQNYAMVLHRGNRPAEALAQVERLLAADPRNPHYRNLKAVVLCRTGEYDEANALYAGILAEHPGQARIWLSHGHALKTAGDTAGAVEAYRRSAALEPWFGDAWWSLANLKTFRFEDTDVDAMRAQLARAGLGDEDRLHLEFALGKALEDRADHAAAFDHYARGNALRLARVPYSAADNQARLRRAAGIYDADFFRAREGWGAQAPDPIFIVGMPRAGSTLVEQILASHPLVEGTMELPEITSLARVLRRQADDGSPAPYHEALAALDAPAVRALGEAYLERTRIHRKTGAPFFIDKMPNNFAHAGLIRVALPNARIVDVRRHPMACGFSMFKQQFARGQDFSYSLEDIGRYYRDYVEYMAHFDRVQPGSILRVCYEDLVADTEAQVRRLLDHCGLPFDAACLRFFENDRPVRTASSEQVRQPIYREGLDHWKHFEPWLGPLREALGPLAHAPAAAAGA